MRRAVVAALLSATLACAWRIGDARAQTDAAVAPDPAQTFADARDALDRGDVARARTLLAQLRDGPDRRRGAQAMFLLGEVHERAFEFAAALESYRASVSRDTGGRYAARALARIEYLEQHAEGGFEPLATLERVRSDPTRASNIAAVEALEHAASTFPPGRVRADARLLVAQAYVGRLHRPTAALAPLRQLARDPSTPDPVRQLSAELLVQAYGPRNMSRALVDDLIRLHADPSLIARVERLIRRDRIRYVAIAAVALLIALGGLWTVSAARTGRAPALLRAWARPLPLAHLAVLSLGGAALAHTYDSHDMRPFFGFGLGALIAYLAASAGSVAGSRRPLMLVARASLCLLGVLAVSFLSMDRFDPGMLDGIAL